MIKKVNLCLNMNTSPSCFDSIRPFYDHEAAAALKRMSADPLFRQLIKYIWPDMDDLQLNQKIEKVQSIRDFQLEFMNGAVLELVNRSSTGISSSGFEQLEPNTAYLFISNHRDILLDSAILQTILVEKSLETSEISFGNNLNPGGFIDDFVRMNRMFMVQREGSSKELYEFSKHLSAYIRHTLIDKSTSVWIAQRNGRTKDGNDQTQPGLLKMLAMTGTGNFIEDFKALNIVPVSISYEFEPCDAQKTQEMYSIQQTGKYTKKPGEDMQSTLQGILQPKGHIHVAIGQPLNADLDRFRDMNNEQERTKQLAAWIDRQIHTNYHLFPTNYIAMDMQTGNKDFSAHYSPYDRIKFESYINQKTALLEGNQEELKKIFVNLYSFPVQNNLNLKSHRPLNNLHQS